MKMKYLLLAMFSVCSINFVHAEVVPGFSSSDIFCVITVKSTIF